MRFLKRLFRFYIDSSLHVSLAVAALADITFLNFGYPTHPHLLLFIFCGTIIGYNFVKYAGVANLHHLTHTRFLQTIRLFTLICLGGLIYSVFHISVPALIAGAFFGALTVLYAVPVFRKSNLRSLKGVKVYIIAVVWAGSTVVVPLAEVQHILNAETIIEFVQRFFFVIVLMLPFEIRDLKYDVANLATIPQIFGISKTRWIGAGLLLLMIFLEIVKPGSGFTEVAIISAIAIITSGFIFKAEINQPEYFSSFWVEGIPILWWVVLWG